MQKGFYAYTTKTPDNTTLSDDLPDAGAMWVTMAKNHKTIVASMEEKYPGQSFKVYKFLDHEKRSSYSLVHTHRARG